MQGAHSNSFFEGPSAAPRPADLTLVLTLRDGCVNDREDTQVMEAKYLRLRTPVALGSRFGEWQVCWLGGWGRNQLFYLVMVVKVPR